MLEKQKQKPPIDPVIKAWIDNVIVPVLIEKWEKRQVPKAA